MQLGVTSSDGNIRVGSTDHRRGHLADRTARRRAMAYRAARKRHAGVPRGWHRCIVGGEAESDLDDNERRRDSLGTKLCQ